MTTNDNNESDSITTGELIRDPNMWGAATLLHLKLADIASDWIAKRAGSKNDTARDVMAVFIAGLKTSLFFADIMGLPRESVERHVRHVLRLHYPLSTKPPPGDRETDGNKNVLPFQCAVRKP